MRYYSFFPGCSYDGTAVGYRLSTQAIAAVLELDLIELEDWNCCGSTPYSSVEELSAFCVATRNLALAEKTGLGLVTPCSSCYVVLNRANSFLKEYPALKDKVDQALAAGDLEYGGGVEVRHLLDVVVNDVGYDAIRARVERDLSGLKVAPYYGCQIVRPNLGFDDPEYPQSLDRLVESLGAEVVPFPLKARCCGGSLIISEEERALGLIRNLLECAESNGADCLVSLCPLCQTNLDLYQGRVNRKFNADFNLPVLFFTQLMGLAFGLDPKTLGLDKGIVPVGKMLAGYLGGE